MGKMCLWLFLLLRKVPPDTEPVGTSLNADTHLWLRVEVYVAQSVQSGDLSVERQQEVGRLPRAGVPADLNEKRGPR